MKWTLSWFRSDSNKFLQDPVTSFPLYLLIYLQYLRRDRYNVKKIYYLHTWSPYQDQIKSTPPSEHAFQKKKKISKCFKSIHWISDRRIFKTEGTARRVKGVLRAGEVNKWSYSGRILESVLRDVLMNWCEVWGEDSNQWENQHFTAEQKEDQGCLLPKWKDHIRRATLMGEMRSLFLHMLTWNANRTPHWRRQVGSLDTEEARVKTRLKGMDLDESTVCLL